VGVDTNQVIEKVKSEYFVALDELKASVANQQCTNAEEAETVRAFIGILRSLYADQMDCLKAIKEAGAVLLKKLEEYEKQPTSTIDDL
jgi:hypothetical protein